MDSLSGQQTEKRNREGLPGMTCLSPEGCACQVGWVRGTQPELGVPFLVGCRARLTGRREDAAQRYVDHLTLWGWVALSVSGTSLWPEPHNGSYRVLVCGRSGTGWTPGPRECSRLSPGTSNSRDRPCGWESLGPLRAAKMGCQPRSSAEARRCHVEQSGVHPCPGAEWTLERGRGQRRAEG